MIVYSSYGSAALKAFHPIIGMESPDRITTERVALDTYVVCLDGEQTGTVRQCVDEDGEPIEFWSATPHSAGVAKCGPPTDVIEQMTAVPGETALDVMRRGGIPTRLTGGESRAERIAYILQHLHLAYGGYSQTPLSAYGAALLGHRRNQHLIGTDVELVDDVMSYVSDRSEEQPDEDLASCRRDIAAALASQT